MARGVAIGVIGSVSGACLFVFYANRNPLALVAGLALLALGALLVRTRRRP